MKRYLPTVLLVIACLAGFWYANSESLFQNKDAAEVKQLVAVKGEDIQSVAFAAADSNVQLSRKGDGWEMVKPEAYPVETYEADNWVNGYMTLTYESKIDENAQDLAGFGLDKPAQQYDVTLKDGTVQKLLVGSPLPVAGTTYVKLGDSPVVYEVGDQQLQALVKQPFDFVSKKAVDFDYNKTTTVSIDWKGQKWQLDKVDKDKNAYEANWKLGDKELKPEEGSAVLDKLVGLQTEQMPKKATDVKSDAPELKLDIKETKDGKETVRSYTGKLDNNAVWLVSQDGAWAYAVRAEMIQQIYDQATAKKE
ncbi:DUF4340 domain-containing protein [Paenibacillus sp. MBLB4367]|uniref:DUF4340 domain-containing protein n=1 Tax=Paenibacillus sp. MBLB4367 TaxID=3384767 RepID=UPI0039082E55